ncbi:LON peptidase substrate-binding domain-containing protein [Rubrivirga litoralis]|uniref:LON peptidase substrate-binding domain-containing protein n=1 Tax=Rubrivirga litoralis TaxID=3075598 RepID=A0ABU3BMG9_9BACT|nr:LON peptidase substrate-binding domain-containing protein [Rubrivirga sp. F394]MDT0630483.1 LON peptidase substrate-binding domain-containing protein [Rubrivirga sp. F394]
MPDDRLPLFPLGLVLLPGEPVPLHIFEPRYREMVRVCLDGDQPFGVVYASETALAAVGSAARIADVTTTYDDGRLDIVAVGESRFRVVEVHRDQSYLTADVERVEDEAEDDDSKARQRAIARHMRLLEMAGEEPRIDRYNGVDSVSFMIGRNAGLDLDDKQRLLEMQTEEARIRYLADHLGSLLVRLKQVRELRDLARGDGHAEGFPDLGGDG